MMPTIRKLFSQEQVTPDERAWMEAIREDAIENPVQLKQRVAALTQQLTTAENEWTRLHQAEDPESFLRRPAVAERVAALKAELAPLPARIASAERRRAAFLAAARLCAALEADVKARLAAVLEHSPRDPDARAAQLKSLDTATRVHTRLAGRLAAISSAREFARVADAVKLVRDAREAEIRECDLLRTPGMRAPVIMPDTMTSLLDVAEGRAPHAKEIAS